MPARRILLSCLPKSETPRRRYGGIYAAHCLRGSLCGICPDCNRMIYRAVTLSKIDKVRGGLDVTFGKAEQRLNDSSIPLPNVSLK